MTVNEYREKNPNCEYCRKNVAGMIWCPATNKKMGKRTARKCPCYTANPYEKENRNYNPPSANLIRYATERGIPVYGMTTETILKEIYEKEKKA